LQIPNSNRTCIVHSDHPASVSGNNGCAHRRIMREKVNLSPRFYIPESHHLVLSGGKCRLSIRQETDRRDAIGMGAKNEQFFTGTLLPEVTPFPTSQVI